MAVVGGEESNRRERGGNRWQVSGNRSRCLGVLNGSQESGEGGFVTSPRSVHLVHPFELLSSHLALVDFLFSSRLNLDRIRFDSFPTLFNYSSSRHLDHPPRSVGWLCSESRSSSSSFRPRYRSRSSGVAFIHSSATTDAIAHTN